MRVELEKYLNETIEVKATYKNFAITNNRRFDLFLNVTIGEKVLTDHVWIKLKKSQQKKMKKKTEYTFTAKVDTYFKKGKDGEEKIMDYCLTEVVFK